MADVNPAVSIVMLIVKKLNNPIKRDYQNFFKVHQLTNGYMKSGIYIK